MPARPDPPATHSTFLPSWGSKVARPSGPNTRTSLPFTSLPNSQSENLPPGICLTTSRRRPVSGAKLTIE